MDFNYSDDPEDGYDNPDDDDDSNGQEDERDVKREDVEMDNGANEFWNLGIINLEPEEWGRDGDVKVKMEPGVKKEPVTETWIW